MYLEKHTWTCNRLVNLRVIRRRRLQFQHHRIGYPNLHQGHPIGSCNLQCSNRLHLKNQICFIAPNCVSIVTRTSGNGNFDVVFGTVNAAGTTGVGQLHDHLFTSAVTPTSISESEKETSTTHVLWWVDKSGGGKSDDDYVQSRNVLFLLQLLPVGHGRVDDVTCLVAASVRSTTDATWLGVSIVYGYTVSLTRLYRSWNFLFFYWFFEKKINNYQW